MIRWTDHLWCCVLLALVAVTVGCRSFNMPSLPLLEDLNFLPDKPVPPEVLSRHGPTSQARIDQIAALEDRAKAGSTVEQQHVAEFLAQQIRAERDPVLRERIIQAVSHCRVPLASAVLRAGLNDESPDVQLAACRAWGQRDDPEAIAVLGQIVATADEDVDLRLEAVKSLGQIERPEAADALSAAIQPDQDPAVQYRAVAALESVTDLDYGQDLTAWRDYFSRKAALAARGGPVSEPPRERSLAERTLFWWR
jgi:HEAT repeat protein